MNVLNKYFGAIILTICFILLVGLGFLQIRKSIKTKQNAQEMLLIQSGAYEIGLPESNLISTLSTIEKIDQNLLDAVLKDPERVEMNNFYLDQYEVSNAEYLWFEAFMDSWFDNDSRVEYFFKHPKAPANKSYKPKYVNDVKFSNDNQPVVGVDYFDAYAFAKFMGYRLPTELEWEYACRNGSKGTTYPWGDEFLADSVNIDNDDQLLPIKISQDKFTYDQTLDHKIYQMSGNVSEWVGKLEEEGKVKVANTKGGGCYSSPGNIYSMCYLDIKRNVDFREKDLGFRLAGNSSRPRKYSLDEYMSFYRRNFPNAKFGESYNPYLWFYNYEYVFEKIDSIRQNRRLKKIPGGTFTAGGPENDTLMLNIRSSGAPSYLLKKFIQHPKDTVLTKGFYIDKTEVTNAEYGEFLDDPLVKLNWYGHPLEPADKDYTPKYWEDETFNTPDQPVVGVDWWDAYAYAKWIGKRLPTKEEWEIASRSTNLSIYPWGAFFEKGQTASAEERLSSPVAVKSYPGDSIRGLGLFDMAGNISEWTSSVVIEDETGDENFSYRFINGGNFTRPGNIHSMLFLTNKGHANMRDYSVGFRCVMDK